MASECDGYKSLAAAIVLQAFKDWCDDCKQLASGRGNLDLVKRDMKEILQFANSGWYRCLTDIPPETFIKRLQEEKEKYEYDSKGVFKSNIPHTTKNQRKRTKVGRI